MLFSFSARPDHISMGGGEVNRSGYSSIWRRSLHVPVLLGRLGAGRGGGGMQLNYLEKFFAQSVSPATSWVRGEDYTLAPRGGRHNKGPGEEAHEGSGSSSAPPPVRTPARLHRTPDSSPNAIARGAVRGSTRVAWEQGPGGAPPRSLARAGTPRPRAARPGALPLPGFAHGRRGAARRGGARVGEDGAAREPPQL